jgi:Glycosyl transferase family 2
MADRIRISVVVPTYNGERWLEQALRSVLAQTVQADEVLLADDASSDRSVAIAEEVLSSFNGNVRMLGSDKNLGFNRNLARCVERLSGDVLVECDQDDVWHPDKLAAVAGAFAANPAATMVFSDADIVDPDGRPTLETLWSAVRFTPELRRRWQHDPLGVLLRQTVVTGGTLAVRRSLLEAAVPFTEFGWMDEWLALLAVLRGETPVAISDRLMDYRVHGGNSAGVFAGGWRQRLSRAGWPQRQKVRMWEEAASRVGVDSPESRRLLAAVAFHRRRPDPGTRSVERVRLVATSCADGSYFRHGQGLAMIAHDLGGVLVYGRPSRYRTS